jgi:hypothetical protein
MELQLNDTDGKTKELCPTATTNPIWTDPGANLGLRSERPASNHQNHGTAKLFAAEYM